MTNEVKRYDLVLTQMMPADGGLWVRAEDLDAVVAEDLRFINDSIQALAKTKADLLATRRALKMAQAKALRLHAKFLVHGDWYQIRPGKTSWWSECYQREIDRGARLLDHYAAKFEREAKEMGK